ncbi:MAG: hypothetical protein PHE27_02790 [Alphaproteobacteria bacterium]|nr:hypothetical protein [Alphaproteobacteria bacterium]
MTPEDHIEYAQEYLQEIRSFKKGSNVSASKLNAFFENALDHIHYNLAEAGVGLSVLFEEKSNEAALGELKRLCSDKGFHRFKKGPFKTLHFGLKQEDNQIVSAYRTLQEIVDFGIDPEDKRTIATSPFLREKVDDILWYLESADAGLSAIFEGKTDKAALTELKKLCFDKDPRFSFNPGPFNVLHFSLEQENTYIVNAYRALQEIVNFGKNPRDKSITLTWHLNDKLADIHWNLECAHAGLGVLFADLSDAAALSELRRICSNKSSSYKFNDGPFKTLHFSLGQEDENIVSAYERLQDILNFGKHPGDEQRTRTFYTRDKADDILYNLKCAGAGLSSIYEKSMSDEQALDSLVHTCKSRGGYTIRRGPFNTHHFALGLEKSGNYDEHVAEAYENLQSILDFKNNQDANRMYTAKRYMDDHLDSIRYYLTVANEGLSSIFPGCDNDAALARLKTACLKLDKAYKFDETPFRKLHAQLEPILPASGSQKTLTKDYNCG